MNVFKYALCAGSIVPAMAFVFMAGSFSKASAAAPDNTQLVKSFILSKSTSSNYAAALGTGTFYEALAVVDENSAPVGKCLNTGFIAWVRKFFNREAASVALIASITGPNDTPKSYPLYDVSKDDDTGKCLTNIQNGTLTGYFLADDTHPFQITASIQTSKKANVDAATSILAEATDLIGFAGGSAALTKTVASATLQTAASKIDASLAKNWSQDDQQKYTFQISPFPPSSENRDTAEFRVANLVSQSTGIAITNSDVPAIKLVPVYKISLFGDGRGKYQSVDKIMARKLVSAGQGDLDTILKNGISGFTTDNAQSIADPAALGQFCNRMRGVFATFLTDDDALAARYAVLQTRTQYLRVSQLRSAPRCVDQGESTTLASLNSAFTIDDLGRSDLKTRGDFVDHRTKAVAKLMRNPTASAFADVLDTAKPLHLFVDSQVQNILPPKADGGTWGNISGDAAVAQLVASGGFRIGCGHANGQQNLSTVAMIAQSKASNRSAALVISFSNHEPTQGDNPESDKIKISGISFYPVATVQTLMGFGENWPDEGCDLVP